MRAEDIIALSPRVARETFDSRDAWSAAYDELAEPERSAFFWRLAASGECNVEGLAVGLTVVPSDKIETALAFISSLEQPVNLTPSLYGDVPRMIRGIADSNPHKLKQSYQQFALPYRDTAIACLAHQLIEVPLTEDAAILILDQAQSSSTGSERIRDAWCATVECHRSALQRHLIRFLANKHWVSHDVFHVFVPHASLLELATLFPLLNKRPDGLRVFDRFSKDEVQSYLQNDIFESRTHTALAVMLCEQHAIELPAAVAVGFRETLESNENAHAIFIAKCLARSESSYVQNEVRRVTDEHPLYPFRIAHALAGILPRDEAERVIAARFESLEKERSCFWSFVHALVATNPELAIENLTTSNDPIIVKNVLNRFPPSHPDVTPAVVQMLGLRKDLAEIAIFWIREHLEDSRDALIRGAEGKSKKIAKRCTELLEELDLLSSIASFEFTDKQLRNADQAQAISWYREHGVPFFEWLTSQPNFIRTPHYKVAHLIAESNVDIELLPFVVTQTESNWTWNERRRDFFKQHPDQYRSVVRDAIAENAALIDAALPLTDDPQLGDIPILKLLSKSQPYVVEGAFERLGESAVPILVEILEDPPSADTTLMACRLLQNKKLTPELSERLERVRQESQNLEVRKLLGQLTSETHAPITSDEMFFAALDDIPSLRTSAWLKLKGLKLKTNTGKDLTAAHVKKIAALLRQETGVAGSDAQRFMAWLDPESVDVFGDAIYQGALAKGKKNDLWAIHQIAFTYSEQRAKKLFENLNAAHKSWVAYMPVKTLLDVALNRGEKTSRDWFCHYLVLPTSRIRGHAVTALWQRRTEGASFKQEIADGDPMAHFARWWNDTATPPDTPLDYGDRSFELVYAPQSGQPTFRGDDSESTSIPRKRKTDTIDKKQSEAFKETLTAMRGDREVALLLLESMMVEHVALTLDTFEALLEVPLFRALSDGLLWACGESGFMLDDGEAFDADFNPFRIKDEPITLMHITDPRAQAWADRFAASEIVQPFEQLGRISYPPDDPFRHRYFTFGISCPWAPIEQLSVRYFFTDDAVVIEDPNNTRFYGILAGEEVRFEELPERVRFEALREFHTLTGDY